MVPTSGSSEGSCELEDQLRSAESWSAVVFSVFGCPARQLHIQHQLPHQHPTPSPEHNTLPRHLCRICYLSLLTTLLIGCLGMCMVGGSRFGTHCSNCSHSTCVACQCYKQDTSLEALLQLEHTLLKHMFVSISAKSCIVAQHARGCASCTQDRHYAPVAHRSLHALYKRHVS